MEDFAKDMLSREIYRGLVSPVEPLAPLKVPKFQAKEHLEAFGDALHNYLNKSPLVEVDILFDKQNTRDLRLILAPALEKVNRIVNIVQVAELSHKAVVRFGPGPFREGPEFVCVIAPLLQIQLCALSRYEPLRKQLVALRVRMAESLQPWGDGKNPLKILGRRGKSR